MMTVHSNLFCTFPVLRKVIKYVRLFSNGNDNGNLTEYILTIGLEVMVTQNVAQYPLHHVTHAPEKFEVVTSNGLGEDTITRKKLRRADLGPVLQCICTTCLGT